MRAAAKELGAVISAWGSSEDELMREYKEIQRASREKKRKFEVVGMQREDLVLDANILIGAVLGQRVRRILEVHVDGISFFLPEAVYAEAEEHIAALVVNRGGDPTKALSALKTMAALATMSGGDLYGDFDAEARKRLWARDSETGRF